MDRRRHRLVGLLCVAAYLLATTPALPSFAGRCHRCSCPLCKGSANRQTEEATEETCTCGCCHCHHEEAEDLAPVATVQSAPEDNEHSSCPSCPCCPGGGCCWCSAAKAPCHVVATPILLPAFDLEQGLAEPILLLLSSHRGEMIRPPIAG